MGKRLFGEYYYSMENSYDTKAQAQSDARGFREFGKYYVRVAKTGWAKPAHQWAVYLRVKR